MEPFTRVTSVAAVLPDNNIDTDIIFPARFLLLTTLEGLGRHLFHDRRYDGDGAEISDFPLHKPLFRAAQILIVGDNFGSGSSREQAVWALQGFGIKVVIGPGFGEIFYGNCFKNGLLAIVLDPVEVARITAFAETGSAVTVDLVSQIIAIDSGRTISFSIDEFRRETLLNGWDEITMILKNDSLDIDAFEERQRQSMPWLYELTALQPHR